MLNILQGGREGVDELVGQLGQEADGVHVQDCHVTGQLAGVDGDIQGGEKLVFGLKTAVTSQCFDQSRFSWANTRKRHQTEAVIISISAVSSLSPQFVYPNTETTGNSLCLR